MKFIRTFTQYRGLFNQLLHRRTLVTVLDLQDFNGEENSFKDIADTSLLL